MSILSIYDPEVAKRVYVEELLEDKNLEIAKGLILDSDPIEKIIRISKLPIETIKELQNNLSVGV
ncbi:MAG: hypothetical protein FWD19_03205 [Defluviitaleaceae bacterium]|nr:hypothetical protein [Defluviitaleaceae bacterium]